MTKYTQGSWEAGRRARKSASRAVSRRVCEARMPKMVRKAAAVPRRSSGRMLAKPGSIELGVYDGRLRPGL
jgi:hypothetical protein